MLLNCETAVRQLFTICIVPQSGRPLLLETFVAPAGQDSLWQGDREGTAGPDARCCHATLDVALALERSEGSRCQLAGEEGAPGSSNLHPGLGLGRDCGR